MSQKIQVTMARVITPADATAAREALRKAGLAATVRRGQGASRYTLHVTTKEPLHQVQVDTALAPLGLTHQPNMVSLTQPISRFFYEAIKPLKSGK